jgi:hypothetical protein
MRTELEFVGCTSFGIGAKCLIVRRTVHDKVMFCARRAMTYNVLTLDTGSSTHIRFICIVMGGLSTCVGAIII